MAQVYLERRRGTQGVWAKRPSVLEPCVSPLSCSSRGWVLGRSIHSGTFCWEVPDGHQGRAELVCSSPQQQEPPQAAAGPVPELAISVQGAASTCLQEASLREGRRSEPVPGVPRPETGTPGHLLCGWGAWGPGVGDLSFLGKSPVVCCGYVFWGGQRPGGRGCGGLPSRFGSGLSQETGKGRGWTHPSNKSTRTPHMLPHPHPASPSSLGAFKGL